MLRLALLIVLASVAVATFGAADETTDMAKPAAALGLETTSGVSVTLLPGAVTAEKYNLYGLSGGTKVPLGFTLPGEWTVTVPTGYSNYEVTGVSAGIETSPTRVLMVNSCVTIDPSTPAVAIGECEKARLAFKVRRPGLLLP